MYLPQAQVVDVQARVGVPGEGRLRHESTTVTQDSSAN